jgi:2-amino-4-hydroxy-6-hydroxymethyldihydropteridine diphosphokinase
MKTASRRTSYIVGLGSNRRHGRHGAPAAILAAAIRAMVDDGLEIVATSTTLRTPALGPSDREFANAAVLLGSRLDPPTLLALLKRIERAFGRRPGRRWGARVLDLDILAWSGGAWPRAPRRAAPGRLAVPHAALPMRRFALTPAAALAPRWRHPYLRATLRQLDRRRRKDRPRSVDRRALAQ